MTYEECKQFLKEKDWKTDLNIEKMLVAHYVMKNVNYNEEDFDRICGFIHICYSMSNISIRTLVVCFIYEQAKMTDDEILDMPYESFIGEAIQFEV